MIIAIPTFSSRVSPRFDCARSLLVITCDEAGKPMRRRFGAANWAPQQRISRLLELAVDTVICGGIDRWSVEFLQSQGVTVYGWVSGEVEDALTAYLQGTLDQAADRAGGGRCACRRFAGRDTECQWSATPVPSEPCARARRRQGGMRGRRSS